MSCWICQSSTLPRHHPTSGVLFHECRVCGFIFKDPIHFPSRFNEEKRYLQHNNDIDDSLYRDYFKAFIKRWIVPFSKGNQVLDYGSGPTPVLQDVLKRDFNYLVDIYDPFFAQNEAFLMKTYDVITCTEVIEHVQDVHSLFRIFTSISETESILAIMTQFRPDSIDAFYDWFYHRDLTHIGFYTLKTFAFLSKNYPFEIIDTDNQKTIVLRRLGV